MTMIATSTTEWLTPRASGQPCATSRTTDLDTALPRTGDDCDRLLGSARVPLRDAELRGPFLRRLTPFLGAGSAVWTAERRERLRELLVSAGEDAIDPILAEVARAPRGDVAEDAEMALAALGAQSPQLLRALLNRLDKAHAASASASLVRAVADLGDAVARPKLEGMLAHESVEVRDAAALGLGRLGDKEAITALTRHLSSEPNQLVLESIKSALEELGGA